MFMNLSSRFRKTTSPTSPTNGLIGKQVQTRDGYCVLILDKVTVLEPVYKYTTQYEANQHGMNKHDGGNRIGEAPVCKYLCMMIGTGKTTLVAPTEIVRVLLPNNV